MIFTQETWPAMKVRDTFLDFFNKKGHTFVPSSSVVPHRDPSLLFTNAGMNQYKSIFLGTVEPDSAFAQLRCATNSQKCIRAGGKHNDLDDVGKDSYHHTFFEMLGNWSFGQYFKKEAVEYVWELLTDIYHLDANRLYVTYFEGHVASGLSPDNEAKQIWLDLGVSEDHIVPGNMNDNFWEMGDHGPCGPCIELHYDRIGGRNAASLVNKDDPNVIEIWNIVFIQYNREADRSLRLLPNKHIDTGLGFERLVSILQEKSSNYDTDIFVPLFQRIQQITGAPAYRGRFGTEDIDGLDTAYRVVADHVRTCTIAISDGVMPSNVGRGYVVRRILRRGARYGKKYFGAEIGSFFSKIVPTVVEQMGEIFPEVRSKEKEVKRILNEEEDAFALSLDRGETMFNKYAQLCQSMNLTTLPGSHVWRLYDTYGFPIDLTKLMAQEQGLSMNDTEIAHAQNQARKASRNRDVITSDGFSFTVHDIETLERINDILKTDDTMKYEEYVTESSIKAIFYDHGFHANTYGASSTTDIGIVLDRTNFYAESDGQQSDTGRVVVPDIAELEVNSVRLYGGYVLHIGRMKYGSMVVDSKIFSIYDKERRASIQLNHTGTHVLYSALKEVLSTSVDQKGSLVAPDKLRFDFSHKSRVSEEDIRRIEDISRECIRSSMEVITSKADLTTARQIEGICTVSGEIYPDPVRIVSICTPKEPLPSDLVKGCSRPYSIEICGGTHVQRTSEIEDLVILEETAVARGIRRIIATTGQNAINARRTAKTFDTNDLTKLEQTHFGPAKEQILKATQAELGKITVSVIARRSFQKRLEAVSRDIFKEKKNILRTEVNDVIGSIEIFFACHGGCTYYVATLHISSSKVISEVIKQISLRWKNKSVYLIGINGDSGQVVHGCSVAPQHMAKGMVASQWIAHAAESVWKNSGENESLSMGSGTDVSKVEKAQASAVEYLTRLEI